MLLLRLKDNFSLLIFLLSFLTIGALFFCFMQSSNPIFNGKAWKSSAHASGETMTVNGTITKTFLLLLITIATGAWGWNQVSLGTAAVMNPQTLAMIGALGSFGVALFLAFKPTMAPILAPIYAILQGAFLGAISAIFEVQYPGIVVSAVMATIGAFLGILLLYRLKILQATPRFKKIIIISTVGIMLVYLLSFLLGLFGIEMSYLYSGGMIGIGVSLFIVVIASLNLILDFDFIEKGSEAKMPMYMEWYASFGLLVTILWLYIEMLRLMAKMRN